MSGASALGAPAAAGTPKPGAAAPALRIRGLVKAYVAGTPVLRGIDLDFAPRGITAVIGPSGTGKSTLIRCINRLVERLTVMENLLCGRLGYVSPLAAWLRRYPARDIERAFDLLETVGLGEYAHVRADSLSGGQRQRVGIARAVMQEPRLLLADEPTSSLDPKTSVEIMALMAALSETHGFPVIVNIHNVDLARRFAGRIVGMTGGRVVYDGPPESLTDARLKEIYGGEEWLH